MRVLKIIAVIVAGICGSPAFAQGDAWPSKAIRWIVPYPPGGGTDLVSRAVGAKL